MDRQQITFSNGNTALAMIPGRNESCTEILQALNIQQPKALLLVVGGAKNMDGGMKDGLHLLFSKGIAATAAEMDAMIIDGGTKAGVMEMMGLGVAEQERQTVLLGIAPEAKVDYQIQPATEAGNGKTQLDPNHSHFVLVRGSNWGDETEMMFGLAEELAQRVPVVTVLAGGGDIAKQEVLQSVRHGWPVVVLTGSDQLADDIARWWRQKSKRPSFIRKAFRRIGLSLNTPDQDITEIIESGDIYLFSQKARAEELRSLLKYLFLKQEKRVLAYAKERETIYAHMAEEHQKIFKRLQLWIISLGVLVH